MSRNHASSSRMVGLALLAFGLTACSTSNSNSSQVPPWRERESPAPTAPAPAGSPQAAAGMGGTPIPPSSPESPAVADIAPVIEDVPAVVTPPAPEPAANPPEQPAQEPADEEVDEMMGTAETRWVGTWASGPQLTEPGNLPPAPGLTGNTLRQNVFATLSGRRLRVLFSNEFGNGPVRFNSVRLAIATGQSSIDPSSDRPLSFGGSAGVTIPAGQTQLSDPLDFTVTALSSLAISIQFGNTPSDVTGHPGSRTTSYLANGDAVLAQSLAGAATTDHWYFISGIDVEVPAPSAAIVTLGDSITDGRGSTTNGNDRWPDNLARRLQGNPATAHLAVLNQGIGGNAVVSGGLGPTAVARFERDVLDQRGARWVIVLEGVNDIGGSSDAGVAARLIEAYQGFIDRAHAAGLLVYGVPILPFGGSSYDSPAHETARQTVNTWIRTSGRFDAVLALDAAVANPQNPSQLLPAYDTGDRLHLSPAGYQAMAAAIDLTLFVP